MKTDKALRSILSRKTTELPYGFENRIMRQILLEADRKNRVSYHKGLALVSLVSMVLIAGVILALHFLFSFDFMDMITGLNFKAMEPHFSTEVRPIFLFSVYIALLMTFLLGIDRFFRSKFGKSK
jgi:hypothetical protein